MPQTSPSVTSCDAEEDLRGKGVGRRRGGSHAGEFTTDHAFLKELLPSEVEVGFQPIKQGIVPSAAEDATRQGGVLVQRKVGRRLGRRRPRSSWSDHWNATESRACRPRDAITGCTCIRATAEYAEWLQRILGREQWWNNLGTLPSCDPLCYFRAPQVLFYAVPPTSRPVPIPVTARGIFQCT